MLELITPAEMGKVDARAIELGMDGLKLMENAGRAVADAVIERWPDARRMLVLAGPGNNGGDGFVAARHLADAGREAVVSLLGDRSKLKGDAAQAAAAWLGHTGAIAEADFQSCDLVIDALFGAGLSRPLEGAAAAAITMAMASGKPIVAVDVPSGLDGATGEPVGETCGRADLTVTFVRLKPGHVLVPGRTLCGDVRLVDIGAPPEAVAAASVAALLNRPSLWNDAIPRPAADAHKYARGHVAVWSGGELATGASRLAALAAARSGAGAVTIAGDKAALRIHAAHLTSIMLHEVDDGLGWSPFLKDRRVRATVVGPGAGANEGLLRALRQALDDAGAVVMDADVFTLFAGAAGKLDDMIRDAGATAVLTPHEGEFKRLFGERSRGNSKIDRAREAAKTVSAVVVYKGSDTVVASPDGRAAVADNAPPYLATAGAGDVLAGICAGLLAQGTPPFEAAAAAVWLHGEAAKQIGRGLVADDLPAALPAVFQALR